MWWEISVGSKPVSFEVWGGTWFARDEFSGNMQFLALSRFRESQEIARNPKWTKRIYDFRCFQSGIIEFQDCRHWQEGAWFWLISFSALSATKRCNAARDWCCTLRSSLACASAMKNLTTGNSTRVKSVNRKITMLSPFPKRWREKPKKTF